ncbi:ABC transporter permease [Devosia chinhatensis]|uniref:ABC transporter permease n=2 Tax=Devosia aurantiaca TaxID=2714858 RepID=A0A6M1SVJ8_9HYPH|nr:ABC transporter permease [Devosia aurantiaca]NGP16951.1 ABC transporter permease [Devosia aurantiaca]
MSRTLSMLQLYLALIAGGCGLLGLAASLPTIGAAPLMLIFFAVSALSLLRLVLPWSFWLDGVLAVLGAWALIASLPAEGLMPLHHWLALIASWAFAWLFVERLAAAIRAGKLPETGTGLVIPLIFGLALIVIWEVVTRGASVSPVLLPAPSAIATRFAASTGILWADFVQTFIKSVIPGYVIGCVAGLLVAIAVDRSPFLKAGIMPIGNFMSALPIIGIAPIMVMWFGFDWQSKAAVVVAMTFFPMLVNTVAGLNAASTIERDLMSTYAASYRQTLMKLRLPAAGPFIFNALKINSTLALIGAIVAEFFGTPVVGMGFRISTGVGRLAIDLVWAEIAVAAIAGSAFYGVIALIERGVTFWHPSVRGGRT